MTLSAGTLSVINRGATYALIRGDLNTAVDLGLKSLQEDAYSPAVYLILCHAYSGLGQWGPTAKYARLGICFGLKDPRLGAVLAGIYQRVEMTYEAEWVSEHCQADPLNLNMSIPSDQIAELKVLLARSPQRPKRRDTKLIDEESNSEDMMSFSWDQAFSETQLPNWLENTQMDMRDYTQIAQALPDWLTYVDNDIGTLINAPSALPHWLEKDEVSLHYDDLDVPGDYSIYPKNDQAQVNPNSPDPELVEAVPIAMEQDLLLEGIEQAQELGLGQSFKIAIHLDALELTQTDGRSKKIFGPLLLALEEDKLIIAAYEEDLLRQHPWAFSKDELLSIEVLKSKVSLIVEENRTIFFDIGSDAIASKLAQVIKEWS